jgi:hypothetical protein
LAAIAAACLSACSRGGSLAGDANDGAPAGGATGQAAGAAGQAGGAAGRAGGAPGGTTGSAAATGTGGCRLSPDGGDPNDGGPYCPTCQSWAPPHEPDGGSTPSGPDGGALTNGKLGYPGDPGYSSVGCGIHPTQPTSADDRTLGFTAADLLDAIVGPGIADLTWYDGTSTTLRLSARYVNLHVEVAHPDDPDAGTIPFAACGELDAGQAIVTLSTDDGRLAGEDITGLFGGETYPNGQTIFVADLSGRIDLATAHGSLTLPDDWGAVAGSAQVELVGVTPKSSSYSPSCPANSTAADTAWAATESACGYDGKLVARFKVNAPPPACSQASTTIATWRWR